LPVAIQIISLFAFAFLLFNTSFGFSLSRLRRDVAILSSVVVLLSYGLLSLIFKTYKVFKTL